nr:MAG TPA: hypothetical protein [Caudoviricetes sp.]
MKSHPVTVCKGYRVDNRKCSCQAIDRILCYFFEGCESNILRKGSKKLVCV